MSNNETSLFNFENTDENLRAKTLHEVKNVCDYCYKCDLSLTRKNVVFGEGNFSSKIMLIGEGPGQNEDEKGRPFIGRAGQLLNKMLEAEEISREKNIFITNVVKCRPPENRAPSDGEMTACRVYLNSQIQLIRPKIIILCGSTAVKAMLNIKAGITKIRGQWFEGPFGSKMMPFFHPSYLLRYQSSEPGSPKWLTIEDIKEIKRTLDSLE